MWLIQYYFLNLLRPNIPRPTRPEPSSKSVAGSGTGIGPVFSVDPVTSEVATGVEVVDLKLEVVAGSSDEGQPAIPKNIITTHKTKKNFFICFSLYYRKCKYNSSRFGFILET
jgi:hypothetical protein